MHVRSSAKKLDKIDPPQFILSIFPRNGLPPMFYSWRHQLSLLSPTPVTFSIYSIYSCKTPLGWAGGRPPRKVRCALGLTQPELSQPGRISQALGSKVFLEACKDGTVHPGPWAPCGGEWGAVSLMDQGTQTAPLSGHLWPDTRSLTPDIGEGDRTSCLSALQPHNPT